MYKKIFIFFTAGLFAVCSCMQPNTVDKDDSIIYSTTSTAADSIKIELESLSGQSDFSPLEVQNDTSASGGQYIVWPDNGDQILSTASDSATGQVSILFALSQSADVHFQIQADMVNADDDSFYYKMDSGSWNMQNNSFTSGWSVLTPATFNSLDEGSHTLRILRREDGARLDKVILTAFAGTISSPYVSTTTTSSSGDAMWFGTWGCSVYEVESSNNPPAGLSDNTLRQIIRVSIGGSQIRLIFSNRLGNSSLVINSVHLAESTGGSSIDTGTDKVVRFGGSESITVSAGNTVTSDTLDYNLSGVTNMAISIYFGSVPSVLSGHPGSRTTSYIQSGDAAASGSLSSATTTDHWHIIEGIDVLTDVSARAVIGFGDSITDGRGTTTNAQNRWTDVLATRLQDNSPTADQVGVLNAGIGGTLASGSGLSRYDRDVLGQSGKRYVIILYGINDIIYAGASSTTITNAYKTYITKAHSNNMLAYGGTILPFGGFSDYTSAREQVRQEVNDWIKSTSAANGGFDAVIDFDAALRDPGAINKLLSTYDSGDGLHPGPAGYQRMGETINLILLTE